jgi:hypothetical protein
MKSIEPHKADNVQRTPHSRQNMRGAQMQYVAPLSRVLPLARKHLVNFCLVCAFMCVYNCLYVSKRVHVYPYVAS